MLTSLCGAAGMAATAAQANQYQGLLAYNTGSGVVVPPTSGVGPGYVFWSQSWPLPDGMQYAGFTYTGAIFISNTQSGVVGGVSTGFLGTGGNAPATLMFPWTKDCSIASQNHAFAQNGAAAGNGSSCNDTGNTSGWNYDNSEVESANTGINPQASYSDLTLETFCQSIVCRSPDTNESAVTNLSADVIDPQNTPSGGASWSGYGGGWVQTNSDSVTLDDYATDPAGVCALYSSLSGPESLLSPAEGNTNPGLVNAGGVMYIEFANALDPCWTGTTDTGAWTIPSGIASGTYTANVGASNPGNYQGQGWTGIGSPVVASYVNAIYVDDTTPVLNVAPSGSGNTGTVSVTVGPSGIGSVSCTKDGNAETLTPESGNPGGGDGTYNYDFNTNTSNVACSASNGDGNGALTGIVNTPTIQINPGGYTQGDWTSQPVTIAPQTAGVGGDGLTGLTCAVNGTTVGTPTSFAVSDLGVDTVDCSVQDPTNGSIASASFTVDEDTQVPQLTFDTGGGYAATSPQAANPNSASGQIWLNGIDPVTIGVTGTEADVLSGVSQTTCIPNGFSPGTQTLQNASGTPFDDSFTLTGTNGGIDGQNVIVCSGITGADVTGADGSTVGSTTTEYVDVSNDNWPHTPGTDPSHAPGTCGISPAIDNGTCAYSGGPSQTAWQRTAQTVTIRADHTGGGAPITSITCSGVTMPVSSWDAADDPQAVDGNNGMTVVATVEPQGGTLTCSASDSAVPADTYNLGTYVFPIDSVPPAGFFEAPGSNGAPKDVIQVHASDAGSGVAQVVVQATDTSTGQVYAGSALTGNPADGTIAYATYNPGSQLYDMTVDPALLPASHTFAFSATVSDVAGNSSTLNTLDPADGGGPFVLSPGGSGSLTLGDTTQLSVTAGAQRPAPAAKTAKQTVTATTLPVLPPFLRTASSSSAQVRAHFAGHSLPLVNPRTAAKTKACYKHRKIQVRVHVHTKKGHSEYTMKTVTKRVRITCPATAAVNVTALMVPYHKTVTMTGSLLDTSNTAVTMANALVTVYETDQATGETTIAGQTTTSSTGAFTYTVSAGPSRQVTLVYAGSANQRGTAATFMARYIGKTTVNTSANLVTAGNAFELTGRLYGGDIPNRGAIAQVYYLLPGHTVSWAPFKRAQTNRDGIFVVKLPTSKANAGYTYKLRVEVPSQNAWGFQKTMSNIVTVRIRALTAAGQKSATRKSGREHK
jgi:hypothetical protein